MRLKLAEPVLNLLFPPLCMGCRAPVGDAGFCAACWGNIVFLDGPLCACCGTPFAADPGMETLCAACHAQKPAFASARAILSYDENSRGAILALKHADRLDLVPGFARWLGRSGRTLLQDCDVIVPVPLHWTRLATRRFNQAALLAQAIGRSAGLPILPQALQRRRATRSQGHLGRLARFRNVKGAIAVAERHATTVTNRRILLIDDVITTGATIESAAKALISAGARQVDVLALAKVVRAD